MRHRKFTFGLHERMDLSRHRILVFYDRDAGRCNTLNVGALKAHVVPKVAAIVDLG